MYVSRYSKASPYVRKILLADHHLGLRDYITLEVADTSDPSDSLREQNPTGRIPVLVKQDGSSIYDSRVIMDFLERQSDNFLFPEKGDLRDYFEYFFYEIFYKEESKEEKSFEKTLYFVIKSFNYNEIRTKSEIDNYLDLYKIFNKSYNVSV